MKKTATILDFIMLMIAASLVTLVAVSVYQRSQENDGHEPQAKSKATPIVRTFLVPDNEEIRQSLIDTRDLLRNLADERSQMVAKKKNLEMRYRMMRNRGTSEDDTGCLALFEAAKEVQKSIQGYDESISKFKENEEFLSSVLYKSEQMQGLTSAESERANRVASENRKLITVLEADDMVTKPAVEWEGETSSDDFMGYHE